MNKKVFTISFSILYTLGLFLGFSADSQNFIVYSAFFVFLILGLLILCLNLGFKKSIVLYLIFLLGIIRAQKELVKSDILENLKAENATIEGQIEGSQNINQKTNKVKFYIKAKKLEYENGKFENLNSKILVDTDMIENQAKIGDYIEIKGKLRPPKSAKNPYQFDYKKYLFYNGANNVLYANSKTLHIIKEADDFWHKTLKYFDLTRTKILLEHSKIIKSPRLEVLGGIVFGNETINVDENIKENFKNSGLLHLLAASGLNVALIYGIWWQIAKLIRFPYNLSIFTGGLFVILYTFMTGFPPSILRASLMLLFVLFGKLIDRNADSNALIFFVGFLILLFNPKMLFDIGFQLSFIVTFGLIACCPVISSKFTNADKKFKEKYKNKPAYIKYPIFIFSPMNLINIIMVPLIAQIWVIPLQMYYFNNFAPLSVLANICVIPFIGLLSFIGFISSIFALVPFFNKPMIYLFDTIANPLLGLLIKISEFFSSFKISLITTIGLNPFQIFSFWGVILLLVLNLKNNFKNKKHIIAFFILLGAFSLSFMKINTDNLEIMMFDVENADCFLIKTPKDKYIMIDTGKKNYKSSTSAQTVILKYLRNKRINNIDILIITHFDIDHCGGVLDILKETKTDKIYIQNEKNTLESKEIMKYLKENNLNYKTAQNQEIIYSEPNLKITNYVADIKNNNNESSIVTLVNYKDKNILFMADCGVLGFNKIKNYMPSKIDILKLGHHGAKNTIDENMIKRLNPVYVLISVGFNKFNHPHYSTLNLLYDKDIKVIPTQNYGFTKITIKDDINFKHCSKNKIKPLVFENGTNTAPFHQSKYLKETILQLSQ